MNVQDAVTQFGFLRLDSASRKIFIGKRAIVLRNKEFSLLEYFMCNIGKVLSRTQILEDVWDRNICCATNTVDVHISTLRQKLKKYDKRNIIRTVHCIGYIFEA